MDTAVKSERPERLGKDEKKRWKLSSYQSSPEVAMHRSGWKPSAPLHLSARCFKRCVSESHFCLGVKKNVIFFFPQRTWTLLYTSLLKGIQVSNSSTAAWGCSPVGVLLTCDVLFTIKKIYQLY